MFSKWIIEQINRGDIIEKNIDYFEGEKARIFDEFKKMPLSQMYPGVNKDYKSIVKKLREMF